MEVERLQESEHTFSLYLRFGMIHSQYFGLQCKNDELHPYVSELRHHFKYDITKRFATCKVKID